MTTTPAPSIGSSLLTGTSTGPFATGFKYGAAEDVRVWLELAGVRQPDLTLTADYTLTGANPVVDGGTITLSEDVAPVDGWDEEAGDRLIWARQTVKRQALALSDTEAHRPRATEQALDKLMRVDEEQGDQLALTLSVPAGEAGIELLPAALRDGYLPVFSAGGIARFDTPEMVVATDADGRAVALPITQLLVEIGVVLLDDGEWTPGADPSSNDDGVWG